MLLRSGELDQTRILRIMEVAPFFLPACNLSGGWKAWQRDICRCVEPELLFSISGFLHLEEVHLPYPAASVWVSWMEWRLEVKVLLCPIVQLVSLFWLELENGLAGESIHKNTYECSKYLSPEIQVLNFPFMEYVLLEKYMYFDQFWPIFTYIEIWLCSKRWS